MVTVLTPRRLPPPQRERIESLPGVRLIVTQGREAFRAVLPEAEVLFGGHLRTQDLERAARLRWVQVASAGVETWPMAELARRGIVLTNARGMAADTVADHAFLFMLALSRSLPAFLAQQTARRWERSAPVRELAGQTCGIIGFGGIGQAVAKRAIAAGMRVLALRRRPQPQAEQPQADVEVLPTEAMDRLLSESDFLVLTCALTPETRHLIDGHALNRVKPGAYLINVARGAVVDTEALVEALRQGRLAGAGLDVFEEEPLPPDHPLWSIPGVLITPHVAGSLRDYDGRAAALFADNLERYLRGAPLLNVVDLRTGY
ncbi:MAG: D-2-hydroxyacid dehydrogenase [Clostridia bacterium]|nr:D-2-hydroxyacid dehydrogenase [Clostridia bacterium]